MATTGGSEPSSYLTRGFLFADLRGYTEFAETQGNRAAAELLDDYRRLVRDVVQKFGGAEIKTEGDSFYIVFPSASGAVKCGLAISEAAAAASSERPERPIRVGIGIHAGETSETDDGFVGSAVNTAARICAEAHGGEVLVSETVRSIAGTGRNFTFTPRGRRKLKGIAEPVALYAARSILESGEGAGMATLRSIVMPRIPAVAPSWVAAGLATLVVLAVLGSSGFGLWRSAPSASPLSPSVRPSGTAIASASPGSTNSSFAPFLPPITAQVKIAMPGGPRLVAKTDDAIWVALGDHIGDDHSTTLKRVDPITNQVTATVHFDDWASSIVGDGQDLWVALRERGQLVRIDGRTNEPGPPIAIGQPYDLAVRAGFLWVTASHGSGERGAETLLEELDHRTGKVIRSVDFERRLANLTSATDAIWMSGDAVWRIDPADAHVLNTFNVSSRPFAVGAGSFWVVDGSDTISRMDTVLGRVQARTEGPRGTRTLTFASRSVWAMGTGGPGSVLRIDPASNRPVAATAVLRSASAGELASDDSIAEGFGSIWICDFGDGELWRLEP